MEPNDKPDPDSLAYWQTKLTEAWNKPDFVLDDTRYVLIEMYNHFQMYVKLDRFLEQEQARREKRDFAPIEKQIQGLRDQTEIVALMVQHAKSREAVIDTLWAELKKGREEAND